MINDICIATLCSNGNVRLKIILRPISRSEFKRIFPLTFNFKKQIIKIIIFYLDKKIRIVKLVILFVYTCTIGSNFTVTIT